MNRSQYRLMALDVDGTLVNTKKEITPATRAALMKAQQSGIHLAIASGRPSCGIRPKARELELEKWGGFILAFNGAKVIDCQSGEALVNLLLTRDQFEAICDMAQRLNGHLLTYQGDTVIAQNCPEKFLTLEAGINGMGIRETDCLKESILEPVNKCLMVGEPEDISRLEKEALSCLGSQLNIFRSEPYFLELMPKGVDKAAALDQLLKKKGWTQEQLIACGDGFNDQTMIEYAGLGVAMANAQKPVLAAADYIAPSCDEDGLADVVEKFLMP